MRVGIVGTGAIANKHADSYKEIGYQLVAASNRTEEKGRDFCKRYGAEFVPDYRDLCRRSDIDFVDVCSFPDSRLAITREAVTHGKHVLVQKPIALDIEDAEELMRLAQQAGLQLGVVSQYRFGDASETFRRNMNNLEGITQPLGERGEAIVNNLERSISSIDGGYELDIRNRVF